MATKPYATCTCEANLSQLRMDWNRQSDPDLSDIGTRLNKIREQHQNHASGIFDQFQAQYSALSARLITEKGSSPDFPSAGVAKKTRVAEARIIPASSSSPTPSPQVPVVEDPLDSPAQKPQHRREPTHTIPHPAPQPKHSRSGFRIPPSPPKPSSDASKTKESHE